MIQPTLETPRLVLRPFTRDDVADVVRLAGDERIAETTVNIPHPYEPRHAESWIGTHAKQFEEGTLFNAAVVDRVDGTLYGAVGLEIQPAITRAEIGYWIGVPYWRRGYATEASKALIDHAFGVLGLHRVMGRHVARNVASGRVLQKIGMRPEGTLRQHTLHGDGYDDMVLLGLLRSEYGAG